MHKSCLIMPALRTDCLMRIKLGIGKTVSDVFQAVKKIDEISNQENNK